MATLNQILGTLPSGAVVNIKDDTMTGILRDRYLDSTWEKKRRAKSRDRLDLFNDNGRDQFIRMIDDVFTNSKVRKWRKKFVDMAMLNNVTKRIIRETSQVYGESALRVVDQTLPQYKRLQNSVRQDRKFRELNEFTNLLNETLVWFDITPMGNPVIRNVTPDNMFAIAHPNDPTDLVGVIIDQAPRSGKASDPHFLVLDDETFFKLNRDGRMIKDSREAHGLTRLPAILNHKNPPTVGLWDTTTGDDIIGCHKAVTLLNVMLLKHQKEGTKQGVLSGDLGNMATGQPMDGEHLINAPEGSVLNTLDLGADPKSYIEATRAVIRQMAANHGVSEAIFDLDFSASSGFEIELKRIGLREIRRNQLLDYRPLEADFAEIMSEVLIESSHPDRFSTDGWKIDFGEVETPQEPSQRISYWKELRGMGLMNTLDMYIQLNPEATIEEAREAIRINAEVEARRVELFRSLAVSPDASSDGSDTSQGQGAPFNGAPKSQSADDIAREVLSGADS